MRLFKRLARLLAKINIFLLDLAFPIRCVYCRSFGEWICHGCFEKIRLKEEQVCHVCEKNIVPGGAACFNCRGKSPLFSLLAATEYESISLPVHLFKYKFIRDLNFPLGKLLAKSFVASDTPLPDLIIPVPLHKKRLRWRGYNQSRLLSQSFTANLGLAIELEIAQDILGRTKNTSPQMTIKNFGERKNNIAGAFAVAKNRMEELKDKRILLIDDICTTGSTIIECAKVLKQAGAKEISALVLARQKVKKK